MQVPRNNERKVTNTIDSEDADSIMKAMLG